MKRIDVSKLVPGMVIAEDVYSKEDQLILPRHITLTDKMICRLEQYFIPSVYIIEDDLKDRVDLNPTGGSDSLEDMETEVSGELLNQDDYFKFRKNYYENLNVFKNSLNHLVNHKNPVDMKQLLHNTLGILDDNLTTLSILEMLQRMSKFDDITYQHCFHVALICNILGKWLKFPEEEIDILTLCGLLHDVGKLLLPSQSADKPDDLLEFERMKEHTFLGYELLQKEPIDQRIKNTALMHHERCDGSGFPQKLKSDQIEDFAKIVAIADVYDSIITNHFYQKDLCPFQIIEIFETEGLNKFEKNYLLLFMEHVVSAYINHEVLLSNGETGRIVLINKLNLSRPVVKTDTKYLDLSKETKIFIMQVL